jgi:hypothetical protein
LVTEKWEDGYVLAVAFNKNNLLCSSTSKGTYSIWKQETLNLYGDNQVPITQVPITQVPITQVPITQVPITQVSYDTQVSDDTLDDTISDDFAVAEDIPNKPTTQRKSQRKINGSVDIKPSVAQFNQNNAATSITPRKRLRDEIEETLEK